MNPDVSPDGRSCKLRNGVVVPMLGIGTFPVNKSFTDEEYVQSLKHALQVGYRHIDSSRYYNNEHLIAQAIKESGLKREDLFIASKVPPKEMGFENTMKAFETSCKLLQTDYIDLYCIHFPGTPATKKKQPDPEYALELRLDTWRALEQLYKDGKVRAIGVSNYDRRHIDELVQRNMTLPMLNECEFHVYYTNRLAFDMCKELGIQFEGYIVLGRGAVLDDPKVIELAKKYSKTPAQVAIRWSLQNNAITIPASLRPERIEENFNVFDFSLTEQDMNELWALNKDQKFSWDPTHVI